VLEGEYEFRCDGRLFKATKDSSDSTERDTAFLQNTGNALGKTLPVLIPGGMEIGLAGDMIRLSRYCLDNCGRYDPMFQRFSLLIV
jgi:hypothetical protein